MFTSFGLFFWTLTLLFMICLFAGFVPPLPSTSQHVRERSSCNWCVLELHRLCYCLCLWPVCWWPHMLSAYTQIYHNRNLMNTTYHLSTFKFSAGMRWIIFCHVIVKPSLNSYTDEAHHPGNPLYSSYPQNTADQNLIKRSKTEKKTSVGCPWHDGDFV